MNNNRTAIVAKIGLGLLDVVIVTVASIVISLAWMAVWLAIDPVPQRLMGRSPQLAGVAALLVAVVFWSFTGRSEWCKRRRWIRPAGLVAIVCCGLTGWMFVQSIINGLRYDSDADWMSLQLVMFLLVFAWLFVVRRVLLGRKLWNAASRAGAIIVLAVVIVCLAHDAPPSPSIARNRAAVLAGANEDEATYQLTLRFTKPPGGGQAYEPPANKLKFPDKEPALIEYLRSHRTEIEANWNEISAVRDWWSEMAAAPVLGDKTDGTPAQPFIRFAPVRGYTEHALALARLRALDGDGDAALEMAGRVYIVGAHLVPGARTLVRAMIGVTVQRQSLDAVDFILKHAAVSPEARRRLAVILESNRMGAEEARRLTLTETEYTETIVKLVGGMDDVTLDSSVSFPRLVVRLGAALRRVFLNPQATVNLIQDRLEHMAELGATRQQDRLEAFNSAPVMKGFAMKNLPGRLLVGMITPHFGGIIKTYWSVVDRREALVKRLNADE